MKKLDQEGNSTKAKARKKDSPWHQKPHQEWRKPTGSEKKETTESTARIGDKERETGGEEGREETRERSKSRRSTHKLTVSYLSRGEESKGRSLLNHH